MHSFLYFKVVRPLLIFDIDLRITFRDVLEGVWVLSVASNALWKIHFSLRIRALLFICWLEWVLVSLVSFWGVFFVLRYSSLHSTHYSHFLFTLVFIFLTLITLPKRGIFVDPLLATPKELSIFIHLFFWKSRGQLLGASYMGRVTR